MTTSKSKDAPETATSTEATTDTQTTDSSTASDDSRTALLDSSGSDSGHSGGGGDTDPVIDAISGLEAPEPADPEASTARAQRASDDAEPGEAVPQDPAADETSTEDLGKSEKDKS